MDIDLGDLPTDEEFAEAEASTEPGGAAPGGEMVASGAEEASVLGLLQLWVTLVAIAYVLVGWGVGAVFAFKGAAGLGWAALSHPSFYLIVLFWPIAVWQLLWNQL